MTLNKRKRSSNKEKSNSTLSNFLATLTKDPTSDVSDEFHLKKKARTHVNESFSDPESDNEAMLKSEDEDDNYSEEESYRDHYIEVPKSKLRNDPLQCLEDPKYQGKIVSKNELYASDTSDTSEIDSEESLDQCSSVDESENEMSIDEEVNADKRSTNSSSLSSSKNNNLKSHFSEKKNGPKIKVQFSEDFQSSLSTEDAFSIPTTLEVMSNEDNQKGEHVQAQMEIYDMLMELRIRMQKLLSLSNQLPLPQEWSEFKEIPELEPTLIELESLVKELSLLHHEIDPSFQLDSKLKSHSHLWSTLESYIQNNQAHLFSTLDIWQSKAQLQTSTTSISTYISSLTNHPRSKTKTQVNRNQIPLFNGSTPEQHVELYDDFDFYSSLLRDIISRKSSQPLPFKTQKLKRKLTRTTKGRLLRYDVHPKLQNFMVPKLSSPNWWPEPRINELFQTLFGQTQTPEEPVVPDPEFPLFA